MDSCCKFEFATPQANWGLDWLEGLDGLEGFEGLGGLYKLEVIRV